jgi:hypothetical protein
MSTRRAGSGVPPRLIAIAERRDADTLTEEDADGV